MTEDREIDVKNIARTGAQCIGLTLLTSWKQFLETVHRSKNL